jgi:hypothetical protein
MDQIALVDAISKTGNICTLTIAILLHCIRGSAMPCKKLRSFASWQARQASSISSSIVVYTAADLGQDRTTESKRTVALQSPMCRPKYSGYNVRYIRTQ